MIMWYHKHHLVVSSNPALAVNCKYTILVAMKNIDSVILISYYDCFRELPLIFNLHLF